MRAPEEQACSAGGKAKQRTRLCSRERTEKIPASLTRLAFSVAVGPPHRRRISLQHQSPLLYDCCAKESRTKLRCWYIRAGQGAASVYSCATTSTVSGGSRRRKKKKKKKNEPCPCALSRIPREATAMSQQPESTPTPLYCTEYRPRDPLEP